MTALFIHLLATTALYFFSGDVNFPRSVLIVYWLVNAAGLAAIREVVGRRLAASSPTRVLLVGTGEEIEQFLEGVGEPRLHHVDIVGAVAVAGDTSGNGHTPAPFVGGLPWLGELGDLPRLLVEHDVGEIVLLSPLSWRDRLVDRMLRQARRPRVSVVPSVYDILVGRVSSGRIHDIPVVEVVKNPRDDLAYLFKRTTDFLIAGILALVASPFAARRRRRREARLAGSRLLSPAPGRAGRPAVHDLEVPHHARPRRRDERPRAREPRGPARDARRARRCAPRASTRSRSSGTS